MSAKRQYNVYLVGHGLGCYEDRKVFAGTTWAVSPKKAASNVRFRCRDQHNPNGGCAEWVQGDILEEGFIRYEWVAEPVGGNA